MATREEVIAKARAKGVPEDRIPSLLSEIEAKVGPFDSDSPEPIKPEIPKKESLGRGAVQGATLNFGDEATGGIRAAVQKGLDVIEGNKQGDFKQNYREFRDEVRVKNEAARLANPKSYGLGEVAGGMATMAVPGIGIAGGASRAANVAKMSALGAGQALGASSADLTDEDNDVKNQIQATKDIATGGMIGAVAPLVLEAGISGISKVGGVVKRGIESAGKKALSMFLGPTENQISIYMSNPDAIKNALSLSEVANLMPKSIKELSNQITADDNKAWKLLRTSLSPDEGAWPKAKIQGMIDSIEGNLNVSGGGKVGPATKQASRVISDISNDINKIGGSAEGTGVLISGKQGQDTLSESNIREIIQSINKNINWNDTNATQLNEALTAIEGSLNSALKSQNPAYGEAMKPVAKKVQTLNGIVKSFNLRRVPGQELMEPTDTTIQKLGTVAGDKKAVSQELLGDIKNETGDDFLEMAKRASVAEAFKGGKTQGSRNVRLGAAAGSALGGSAGAIVGGPTGAAVGGAIGATAGGIAGGYADKKGGEMAAGIIDWYLKNHPSYLGRYVKPLSEAAAQGGQALAVMHTILQNNDPEYKKHIESMPYPKEAE